MPRIAVPFPGTKNTPLAPIFSSRIRLVSQSHFNVTRMRLSLIFSFSLKVLVPSELSDFCPAYRIQDVQCGQMGI